MQAIQMLRELGDVWALDWSRAGRFLGEEASEAARMPRLPKVAGSVAIIQLYGIITQKESGWGTSTEMLNRTYSAAMSRQSIKAVVTDVDSPGGTIYGISEAATKIMSYRGTKPSVAVTNPLNASAAYWLASAHDLVVSTPSGVTGSIGIWREHENIEKALADAGVDITLFYQPRFKVEANPYGPLSEATKEEFQRRVDEHYGNFVTAVSKQRGVAPSVIKSQFGEGRVLTAEKALEVDMVDRIGTLEEVLAGMGVSAPGSVSAQDASDTEFLCQAWEGQFVDTSGGSPDVLRRLLDLKEKETK